MRIGTVRELWPYPVKSMAGERLERCSVAKSVGIPGDRGWALRDEVVGEIRGAKKIPALMCCAARYLAEPVGHSVPPEVFEFASPPGSYFDAYELHLITTASLAELARRAPDSRIDVRRFRPNVVVEAQDGARGFPEIDWCGRELQIGGARAHVVMPMMRCAMTTWAHDDLPKDPAIMRALVRETQQNLGIGMSVVAPGAIALGDPVELL